MIPRHTLHRLNPPVNQIDDTYHDPRTVINKTIIISIYQFITNTTIHKLAHYTNHDGIYVGNDMVMKNRHDLHTGVVVDNTVTKTIDLHPIVFEEINQLAVDDQLYDGNYNVVLEPINGDRYVYRRLSPIEIATLLIYDLVCEKINIDMYFAHNKAMRDPLDLLRPELLNHTEDFSTFTEYLDEIVEGLMEYLIEELYDYPTNIVSIALIGDQLVVRVHCDYRLWLTYEKE